MSPHKLHRCPTISEKHEKRRFNRCMHASDRVKTLEANPPSDDKLGKSGTRKKKNRRRSHREAPFTDASLVDIFFTRICVTRICVTRPSNAICPSCSRITWITVSPGGTRAFARKVTWKIAEC